MVELKDVIDWFGLGVHLGMDIAKLKGIERRNGDIEECKHDMLQAWIDTEGEPSWYSIVRALRKIQENDLAEKLEKKYRESFCTSSQWYIALLSMCMSTCSHF